MFPNYENTDYFPNPNDENPVYEAWKAYALFIIEAILKFFDKVPVGVALIMTIIISIAANQFLPVWARFAIWAAIALPFAWLMVGAFRACKISERANFRE